MIYIYIYTFSRRFYPKRLTVHSGYTCFSQYDIIYQKHDMSLYHVIDYFMDHPRSRIIGEII